MHLSKNTIIHISRHHLQYFSYFKLRTCNILHCQFLIKHFSNSQPHVAIVIRSRELHIFVPYFMFSMNSSFWLSFISVHFQIILAFFYVHTICSTLPFHFMTRLNPQGGSLTTHNTISNI